MTIQNHCKHEMVKKEKKIEIFIGTAKTKKKKKPTMIANTVLFEMELIC